MANPGDILQGRYRIDAILGQGGMAGVYLATHLELNHRLAIKQMELHGDNEERRREAIKQFRREAQILHGLRHNGLPHVYDFFEHDGQYYLVMEFINGPTLQAVLQGRTRIPEAQVMVWARELCEVLDYLHSHDPPVIFRDLKPANIMLNSDGHVKLIDFGIAKSVPNEADGRTTTFIRNSGSAGFAPVEQYGAGTDVRSDIYALGATLYVCLTGVVPPQSLELAANLAVLKPLVQLRPDVSERTAEAIEKMMQLDRNRRPQSARVVMDLLFGPQVGGSGPLSRPAAPEPQPQVEESSPLPFLLGDLLDVVVKHGCSGLYLNPGRPPTVRIEGELIGVGDHVLSEGDVRQLLWPSMPVDVRRRLPEDQKASYTLSHNGSYFRNNVVLHEGDMWATIRRVRRSEVPTPQGLRIPPEVMRMIRPGAGLVVVAGPRQSGKSTTLAALAHQMNQERKTQILTVEDPIEYVHKPARAMLTQWEIGTHARDYEAALQRAMALEPDILIIDEMRDPVTVVAAVKAASRALVVGALQADDSVHAIDRLLDLATGHEGSLAERLRGVVAQALHESEVTFSGFEVGLPLSRAIREGRVQELHQSVVDYSRSPYR